MYISFSVGFNLQQPFVGFDVTLPRKLIPLARTQTLVSLAL